MGSFIQLFSALVFFLTAGLLGVQVRESEMRGEIMRLQKEHMKTLMAENKELMETNDRLVAHVAEIEAKHAQVAVEHSHLGGAGDISYHAIVSERDLAVHKLGELADQFQTFKNTAANSNSVSWGQCPVCLCLGLHTCVRACVFCPIMSPHRRIATVVLLF